MQARHAHACRQARHVHGRDVVSQRLEILHDHAESTHAKAFLHALAVRAVIHTGAVVEALLRLAPVAALREIWTQEHRVDAPKVTFGDIGLEDVGSYEEDVA